METRIKPEQNPLKQYFRNIKIYISLPSGTAYYDKNVIEFTESGEVGIMPMTGNDELMLKNPDALLNGEALIHVIQSCVPAVKNVKALLTNDIDALITAIRYVTYDDALETIINCPKCKHENHFKTDLQYSLSGMTTLEPEYSVYLENGLQVFVKPYQYPDILRAMRAQLEQTKLIKSIENNISEDQRSEIFKNAFKEVATVKFELLSNSIVKISNGKDINNVNDKRFIKEFLLNIDKKSVDRISDLIEEINKIGIKKTFTATCENCSHQWETDIDFNPVNFS